MKLVVIAIALLFTIVACTQAPSSPTGNVVSDSAQRETTIPIGAILILSGPGATWGTSSVNGAQLAIADINAAGGINGKHLQLVAEDTGGEPTKAIDAYHKLRDHDKASFILGTTWTREGLPLVPIAASDDVVMISSSLGVADFNEKGDNLFNVWPHDALLSSELAQRVYDEGHRKVAVFSTQQQWVKDQTDAFVERFTQLGGTVVVVEVPLDDKDQRTEAAKIVNADVDAVVITNTVTGDISARRLSEQGFDRQRYSITMGADIIAGAQGSMEGLRFLSSLTPSAAFEKRYNEAYPGQVFDVGGDSAYDAVMLLAQAMKATGSEDPHIVAQYVRGLDHYNGESGALVFDGKGGVTKPFREFIVRNGSAVPLSDNS